MTWGRMRTVMAPTPGSSQVFKVKRLYAQTRHLASTPAYAMGILYAAATSNSPMGDRRQPAGFLIPSS